MINVGFRNTRPSGVRPHLTFHLIPQSLALLSCSLTPSDCRCHLLSWILHPHLHLLLQIQVLFHDPSQVSFPLCSPHEPFICKWKLYPQHHAAVSISVLWKFTTVLYRCPSIPPIGPVFYLTWMVHTAWHVIGME